jgi:acyl phosphate:glycerol-3-phosphate acyltransferase
LYFEHAHPSNSITADPLSEFFSLSVPLFLGYLVGSVPTAFILVHWKSRIDIREAGSGNVGALNSYEVTRSRLTGALVLLLDLAKGAGAVWMVNMLFGPAIGVLGAGTLGAVAGHNYPVWLKGRGGRGLATAAGAMLFLAWPWVMLWLAVWALGFFVIRDVNAASVVACLAGLATAAVGPTQALQSLFPEDYPAGGFRIVVAVLLVLLLARLVDPLVRFVRTRRSHSLKQE